MENGNNKNINFLIIITLRLINLYCVIGYKEDLLSIIDSNSILYTILSNYIFYNVIISSLIIFLYYILETNRPLYDINTLKSLNNRKEFWNYLYSGDKNVNFLNSIIKGIKNKKIFYRHIMYTTIFSILIFNIIGVLNYFVFYSLNYNLFINILNYLFVDKLILVSIGVNISFILGVIIYMNFEYLNFKKSIKTL